MYGNAVNLLHSFLICSARVLSLYDKNKLYGTVKQDGRCDGKYGEHARVISCYAA